MTFTEAALEVLRSAGEPLHYKRITELAIERNLLSHVGKTPEVTMSSRLAMMVKKDRGQAPIVKVKPGVFAIRESAKEELSPAALAMIEEVEGVETEHVEPATEVEAEVPPVVVETKMPALPGGDVFPEEEGDDDPILAGLEQESEGTDRNGRRRRRRRRRGKGDKPEAPAEAAPRAEPVREPSGRERGERDRDRGRDRDRDREAHREPARESSRDGAREPRESRESVRERTTSREEPLDWNRQPAEGDLLGKDLADAVWHVLSRGERVPHPFSRIADLLVRRGRLSGSPGALAPTIAAAIRADVARAELSQLRPRFRLRGSRVVLSEWLLPRQLIRSEQDFVNAADRYGNELRRALIQRLTELPTAGFAELIATWLNGEGITALRAVRRPGSTGNELHFAGTRKTGSEELRLAIVVLRGGRDIDREGVIDVRGALHHYGQASAAWVVTTGRTTAAARDEAAAAGAAPCALFDGMALACAMERLGIAVRRYVIEHHEIDYELLEMLGDTPEQRERREREQERERQAARREPRPIEAARHSTPPGGDRERASHRESRQTQLAIDPDALPLAARGPVRDADWDEDEVEEAESGPAVTELDRAEEGELERDSTETEERYGLDEGDADEAADDADEEPDVDDDDDDDVEDRAEGDDPVTEDDQEDAEDDQEDAEDDQEDAEEGEGDDESNDEDDAPPRGTREPR